VEAKLIWVDKMLFKSENRHLEGALDAMPDHGGSNEAPTPKELILNAMMGCTAMDVISMLKKMRQNVKSYHLEIMAEKTTEHPTYFKSALIKHFLHGEVAADKIMKSVEASMTKYCGVNYMISKTCDISYQVYLENILIGSGKANFS
jgi:putative redox protein